MLGDFLWDKPDINVALESFLHLLSNRRHLACELVLLLGDVLGDEYDFAVDFFLGVEGFDSSFSVFVANEFAETLFGTTLLDLARLNFSELAEKFHELLLSEILGNVLDMQVGIVISAIFEV